MTGADVLVETMLASGISVCFANPGTSEMSFVASLDSHPDVRCILCLFEGGATGAADGYHRMTGGLAATLLHLGPGFGNGWSNLHNARKANSAVLNVVGDHADYHLRHDAPLQSDLAGIAGSVSHVVRRVPDGDAIAGEASAAIRAAQTGGGQIATLVLPVDVAWSETAARPVAAPEPPARHRPPEDKVVAAAEALTRPGAALLAGPPALTGSYSELAARIAARAGCRLLAPLFAPRIARGHGAAASRQLPYAVEDAIAFLDGLTRIVCVGEAPPVAFFAYPGKPSTPEPPGCAIDRLCEREGDAAWTLERMAEALGVDGTEDIPRIERVVPDEPSGPLDPDAVGRVLARHLPEGAIVVNEAVTAGFGIWPYVDRAAAHDRLNTTGGSIGQCLPCALGAAVACPDRPVFAVSGDGSAMYQVQSLWTAAREGLDITVVILSNRGYQILHHEMAALGHPQAGCNARRMFDIVEPGLDWVALGRGHGVPGARAESAEAFAAALDEAASAHGPFLIEAVL